MKNKITFQSVSDAIEDNYTTVSKITDIIADILDIRNSMILWDKINFPVDNYYVETRRGQKITNILKSILKPYVDKKKLDIIWPIAANEISKLYNSAKTIEAFFADKENIGENGYADSDSCFRNRGENYSNKLFIVKYKRMRYLVLREKGKSGVARCLVYFAGGRTVYLTNFYFDRMEENEQYFLMAIRKMLNLKHIKYSHNNIDVPLPIYLNGDAYCITTEKSFNYPFPHIFPCPQCNKLTLSTEYYRNNRGSTVLIGCCQNHANKFYNICEVCGESGEDCECYICEYCGKRVHSDDILFLNNNEYCRDCFFDITTSCDHCKESVYKVDINHVQDLNKIVCNNCLDKYYAYCESCNKYYSFNNIRIDNNGYIHCESCYNDLYIRCSNCDDGILKQDSQYGYCNDCLEKKEVII